MIWKSKFWAKWSGENAINDHVWCSWKEKAGDCGKQAGSDVVPLAMEHHCLEQAKGGGTEQCPWLGSRRTSLLFGIVVIGLVAAVVLWLVLRYAITQFIVAHTIEILMSHH